MNKVPLIDLIHYASGRRSRSKEWVFFHLKREKEAIDIPVGEVEQFLEYRLQGLESAIYCAPSGDDFLAILCTKDRLFLSSIERMAQETLGNKSFKFASGDLSESSLHALIRIFTDLNGAQDVIAANLIKRLGRMANSAMVLDDDMMVLKLMENIIKNFAHVELFQDLQEFQDAYANIMPDIVFIDVHLRGTRGYNVIQVIRDTIDPFIYPVMISSDARKDTVMAVKDINVQGYLVKPFNREGVYNHLMKAPTFISGI